MAGGFGKDRRACERAAELLLDGVFVDMVSEGISCSGTLREFCRWAEVIVCPISGCLRAFIQDSFG